MRTVELKILRKLSFLRQPHRYKVAWGGRAGGKSWGYAQTLLVLAMQRRLRILCARELQLSIKDSVHRLLSDLIKSNELSSKFKTTNVGIDCPSTGSEFIFSGIKGSADKIRSMEALDIVWLEEAQTISKDSWEVLIPTMRKAGSEIWVTFNRDQPTDPTDQRFIGSPPPNATVVEINWKDNPWISQELLDEKDYLYSVDPEAADWVWGGQVRKRSKAQILSGKWVVEAFEPQPDWAGPYFGIDWGFSVSPTAAVRCWVSGDPSKLDHELWIEHEAWGVGVDNDELPQLLGSVPGLKEHAAYADSARPETISHVIKHGFARVEACKKWPGSVEDGLAHLRGYRRIVVHPRCTHVQQDFRLYSHKTDRLTGEVLPIIVKLHDDCPDAIRYALGDLIRYDPPPTVFVV